MVNLNYPIHLQAAEDGSVTVTFPQVPEAITHRPLDLNHASRLDQAEPALASLGRTLEI
jgi:hypothetical protein